MTNRKRALLVQKISRQMMPFLIGKGAAVQSAVLADLLSIWLAGHWPPEEREEMLAEHINLVRKLLPLSERQIFGPEGHPGREDNGERLQ